MPSGTVVAISNVIQPSVIGESYHWEDFTFSESFTLNASTKYWIVLHGQYVKSDSVYLSWAADITAGELANGNLAYYQNGVVNAWTAQATQDFLFKVQENPNGTNYYIDSANIKIDDGEYSAVYYTSIKDLGYVCDAKIIIENVITTEQALAWDSDASRTFDNDNVTRFTGEESPGNISFEIRTSEDNITWTDWEEWLLSDYHCRYLQVRATFYRDNLISNVILSELSIKVDLPDVDEIGSGTVSVANDGAEITFTKTFHESPSVNIDIISGVGYIHKFSVIPSITGFTVKLYELNGTATTGNFKYHAHGI